MWDFELAEKSVEMGLLLGRRMEKPSVNQLAFQLVCQLVPEKEMRMVAQWDRV